MQIETKSAKGYRTGVKLVRRQLEKARSVQSVEYGDG